MRFLFVAPRFHTNQHFWVKSLIDHGHEVRFWVWNKTPWENYSSLTPERVKRFSKKEGNSNDKKELVWSFPNLVWCWREMRRIKPDIVIIRDPHAYFFAGTLLLIAWLQKRTILVYTQTPLHQRLSFVKSTFTFFMGTIFGVSWVTPAKGDEKTFPKFHPKAFFVPFAIELPSGTSHRKSDKGFRIISIGKLYQKRKNHLLLLCAIKELEQETALSLTLVGALSGSNPEYFEQIKVYIKEHRLEQRVNIKTNLSHQETLLEYAKHDLFVLPSSDEPFAYSPLEAMAAGLPVICSDTNGAKWYLKEGRNGYLFKSNNSEDLKAKIRMLVLNPAVMQSMQKTSRELVEQFHTPEAAYEKIMEVVKESTC